MKPNPLPAGAAREAEETGSAAPRGARETGTASSGTGRGKGRTQGRPKTPAPRQGSRASVGQSWVEDIVTIVLSVPPDRRRHVVGPNGATLRELRHEYPTVRVSVPPPSDHSREVTLKGRKSEVRAAAKAISSHLEVIEAQARRAAAQKQAQVTKELLQVAPGMRRLVVGHGGAGLRGLSQEHPGVTVTVPPPDDTTTDTISIRGPPAGVAAAVRDIKARLAGSGLAGRGVPPPRGTEASEHSATRGAGTLRAPSVPDGNVKQG